MVSATGTIFASDYNNIRTTASNILNGLYGETLVSNTVSSGVNTVTAQQLEDLYIDLQRVIVHQTGSLSTTIDVPVTGYRVGAETAFGYNTSTGAVTAVTNGTRMGINDYISVVTDIANFDPAVSGFPVGSLLPVAATTSQRTTTWGGAAQIQSVYHNVTVTFASATEIDDFFAAGGELRFTASLASGSGSKSTDWASLLSAMANVKFNKYNTAGSSGTGTNLGYDDLTASYQQLFIKTGSGVYADNDYAIEGRQVSATVLRFRITFNDGDVGESGGLPPEFVNNPIDESVNGTLTSSVQPARPSSSFVYDLLTYGVDIGAPTVANVATLDTDYASTPA
jgi:hypothetical protein